MATILDPPAVVAPGRPTHSTRARKMADKASRTAIEHAGLAVAEVDLLLNTGLYHDRNLGEPALAALIQEDVGINPEDPHAGMHGSFSFDIANGACGVLTALQIADGFLRSATIDHALVVASDADPGHGMALGFPFLAEARRSCAIGRGAGWPGRLSVGVRPRRWRPLPLAIRVRTPPQPPSCRSKTPISDGGRQRWRGERRSRCSPNTTSDLRRRPRRRQSLDAGLPRGLSAHAGIDSERVVDVEGAEHIHTAALLVALAAAEEQGRLDEAHLILLVSAGAGVVSGAAVLAR